MSYYIELFNQNLKEIPIYIFYKEDLEELLLLSNEIKIIPKNIKLLQKLKVP